MSSEEKPKRGRPREEERTGDVDILEIVGRLRRGRREEEEGDEITRLMDEEIKRLSKMAKLAALKELYLEKKKEVMDLERLISKAKEREEKVLSEPEAPSLPEVDVRLLTELAKLNEEERRKVVEVYAMMKAAEKMAGESLLPLVVGLVRQNPGASSEQLATMAKTMVDAVRTGVELVRQGQQPQQAGEGTMQKYLIDTFMKMLDMVRESDRKLYDRLMQEINELKQGQQQGGIFDVIFGDERVFNRLKELGFFKPPGEAKVDPRIQLEIEKLKMEHQRELKRMEMEFQLRLKQLEHEQQKMMAMMYGLRQIGAAAADALLGAAEEEQRMEEQPQATGSMEVITVTCPKCKAPISFPKGQERVTCASCGTVWKVTERREEAREAPAGEGGGE